MSTILFETCSQIWLFPLVDVYNCGYITKLGEKKNPACIVINKMIWRHSYPTGLLRTWVAISIYY